MPVVGPERARIKVQVVRRVVAVDVLVFENVGLGAEYAEMSDGVAYYVKTFATKLLS